MCQISYLIWMVFLHGQQDVVWVLYQFAFNCSDNIETFCFYVK